MAAGKRERVDTSNPSESHEVAEPPMPRFPIVGVGASAGGLAAFEAFFQGMPQDIETGMAFVLVQHLAPNHKSLLTELVRRYTRMQVLEVEDGMVVQPNCAYIIPPGRDMAFMNGALHLLEPEAPRGLRLPIDFFFRSLAEDQHERAIAIVLSGTGSDGTLGVRAIKGEGGMVMVQKPESTEFDGMPTSALATGLVDYELLPAEMPAALMAYVAHAFVKPFTPSSEVAPIVESAMQKIFIQLRSHTGHDFSNYKTNTIRRRIERRMAVHQIESIESYVKFLQLTPAEVEALFRDLLIGVTSFFRDTQAFEGLEREGIARILKDRPAGSPVRVWVPGCSTGEEAYSIAMLLYEHSATLRQSFPIQVFATDIDSRAIATARAGCYPASIAGDLTAERLSRFLILEPDGLNYRVQKVIRDLLIFSEQDLIKDPPFSRLDLVSCRNLMIYMGADLQRKLIPLFHYSLNLNGLLFLGTSESVGEFTDLFECVDRKSKIFLRRHDAEALHRAGVGRALPMLTAIGDSHARARVKKPETTKIPLRELTEQSLLRELAPTGALVNANGDILYLHGRAGMYLEPASGEVGINNILKMAREGLRRELTTALHRASSGQQSVRKSGLRVRTNGHHSLVDLIVRPANESAEVEPGKRLYMVILIERVVGAVAASGDSIASPRPEGAESGTEADERILALEQELRAKDEYLQSTHEELETTNDELRSSNEEMQSVNEELQSTNEEMETSKEELQSVNEELSTVNAELQNKVQDLSRSNNDMNNLLAGTGIATVFVDHQLRILRFTPAANAITNLILSDLGRPVGHVVSNLVGYDRLVADAQAVLDTLIPHEVDVQSAQGKWYTLRIQPYRTLDNVIEGVVITFVEISEIVRVRQALQRANDELRLAVVARDAGDAFIVQDLEGRILAWNPSAVRIFGWTEAEALTMNVCDLVTPAEREGFLAKAQQASRSALFEPSRVGRLTKQGAIVEVSMTSTALLDGAGRTYAIATTERLIVPGQGGNP